VKVAVGGIGVCVKVAVGGTGVCVKVAVGGTGVCVKVAVGGTGVCVKVAVGGTGVGVPSILDVFTKNLIGLVSSESGRKLGFMLEFGTAMSPSTIAFIC
jgi:hypothetical protein